MEMKGQCMTVEKRQNQTIKLAKMGVLVAISVLLVNIHFPIFPAVPFLEYDPADIPILIGGFAFGPIAGLTLTVIAAVLQGITVSASSGIYGIIMHVIATGTFVLVASLLYKTKKTKKMAVIGLLAGSLAMTAIMIPANYIVTPYFMNVPIAVINPIMPFIIGFNLIKSITNGIFTFILYKRVSEFLHK